MMKLESILNIQRMSRDSIKADVLNKSLNNRESFQEILKERIGIKQEHSIPGNKKEEVIDKKLMGVCTQMESLFVARMLKEMRNTIHKEKLLGGGVAEEIFEDMLYDEYALELSRSSNLGMARMIYDELSRK